ncbi:MAG TPA: M1 family aminopeptidase, partial [Albitalea sp.]|nr:M1 family aminopeptidase [Albitalea sp.]
RPAASLHPAGWRVLPHLVGLYFRETIKNVYFSVLVLAGVLFLVFASTTLGEVFGTKTWPHTFQMVELLAGTFKLFMLVIIAFYAGELVWREREARLDQIADTLPTPTWLPMLAKLVALMLVPALLQAVLMLCGMAIQLAQGFTRFDIAVYLQALFGIDLVNDWLLCALAIAVHSVVNQKYVGHFVMIVYYLVLTFSGPLGLEHHLLKFGSVPDAVYSDMNGWGPFLPRVWAFQAYWGAASLLLLLAGYLAWTRGTVSGWRERLRVAAARADGRLLGLASLGLAAFAGLGGFIFYNTNVLNHYESTHQRMQRQADYEKHYKALLTAEPQPKVRGVSLDVALYPREQRVRVRGSFALRNKNAVPVDTLNLQFGAWQTLEIHRLELGVPSHLVEDNRKLSLRRYKLAQPLAPGATTTLSFDLEQPTHGFENDSANTAVVGNGSFLNGRVVLPVIGYQAQGELERDQDRRKFGLAPKERLPDRDDVKALQFNPLTHDADWIDFEATLSTEPDQIAIAPGYLQREWTDGGRRFFHYKMDAPILDFYAFQSARYALRKDVWHGGANDVAIEVYYQPGHEYNIASMIEAAKASLDYCSTHFGPYQYRQFRIVEFPRYEAFAQSFPNTIPYSEGIGFIARVRPNDEQDIDYPYYVTAHEAAHQWWGHQVMGADVQGGTMLIETMAQYSALMVMKRKVGEAKMRKFLAYELDRYLTGRAFEQKKELPLARVENQPYIHYRKGSLVMYALADYLGEERLNQAIRRFRDAHAFQGPPYPNTTQFLAAVREVTPPELQYVIDDLFERIVVYDNRAVSAVAKPLPGGRYELTLDVIAKKRVADELGKESDAPLADLIDIGVLDEHGDPLVLQRQRIDKEKMRFTFTLDKKPASAGIDPLNKLIDRRPKDNTVAVSFG